MLTVHGSSLALVGTMDARPAPDATTHRAHGDCKTSLHDQGQFRAGLYAPVADSTIVRTARLSIFLHPHARGHAFTANALSNYPVLTDVRRHLDGARGPRDGPPRQQPRSPLSSGSPSESIHAQILHSPPRALSVGRRIAAATGSETSQGHDRLRGR
jgi:hypothetical protein